METQLHKDVSLPFSFLLYTLVFLNFFLIIASGFHPITISELAPIRPTIISISKKNSHLDFPEALKIVIHFETLFSWISYHGISCFPPITSLLSWFLPHAKPLNIEKPQNSILSNLFFPFVVQFQFSLCGYSF